MEKKNCSINIKFFCQLDNWKRIKRFLDQVQLSLVFWKEVGGLAMERTGQC